MTITGFDIADALDVAATVFNALSPVAVAAIGVGLGLYIVKMVARLIRH